MTGNLRSADDVLQRLDRDGIEHLWVTYRDFNGRGGSKTLPRESFESAVREGVVYARANFNFNVRNNQAPDAIFLADSGDFLARPDPRSYAVMEQFPSTARMNTWLTLGDGSNWDGCPRFRLDSIVETLASEGVSVQASLEPEFYLLDEQDDGTFEPISRNGMYTQDGLAFEDEIIQSLIRRLHAMDIPVEQLGREYGVGQYEMTTRHGSPIQAIDFYYATREVVRYTAREHGHTATFMPKVAATLPGNSLHVHISLWDRDGTTNLTASDQDDTSLSETGKWFMGGLLSHVEALTGLGSPTVNSYKRLQPGTWAPANPYWGYGNRSGVIRVPGTGNRRRIEFRSGDNTCQPELFLTGLLAAGLDGIRKQIDPGEPFQRDVGHLTPEEIEQSGIGTLPRSATGALDALERDEVLVELIGQEAIRHYLVVKRSEIVEYNLEVHPWERETYLQGY